jgi:hypothetical protein
VIYTSTKRYQLVLWLSEDRDPANIAHRAEFDNLDEAREALAYARAEGSYPAGILYEWHSGSWELVEYLGGH